MIELPQIPYAMRKNRSQEITIRGLNLSAAVADGDLADSVNVSTERYPYITEGKTDKGIAEGALSVARFGRDIAVVDADNQLKIGDSVKGTLSGDGFPEDVPKNDRRRQMATVNSKLVVFPDRQYYDSSVTGATVKNLWAETEAAMLFASDRVSMLKGVDKCISGYGGSLKDNEFNVEMDSGITVASYNAVAIGRTATNDKMIGLVNLDDPHVELTGKGDYLNYNSVYGVSGNTITYRCLPSQYMGVADGIVMYLRCDDAPKYSGFYKVNMTKDEYSLTGYYIVHIALSHAGALGYEVDFNGLIGNVMLYITSKPYSPVSIDEKLIRYNGKSVHRIHEIGGASVCYIEDADNRIAVAYYPADGFNGYAASQFKWAYWKESLTTIAKVGETATLYFPGIPTLITGTVQSVSASKITFSGLGDVPWLYAENGQELVYLLSGDVSYADLSEFKVGDVVESSGVTIDGAEANNTAFTIKSIDGATIHTTLNAFTEGVANVGDNYTVSEAKLERKIPKLEFICEANNRLYGCAGNTIYVSALGDPTNMFAYEGVSTDSYAVAVADLEPFTGCCRYGTDVLFFKENKIYKLVGSYPAEFALYSYDVEGVEEGSHDSLCIINETLFYKGIHGVYAYNGGVPTLISHNLGDGKYTEACGGTDGVSYLLSMKDEKGKKDEKDNYKRFSYNTRLGIWMAEGEGERRDVIRIGDSVYYIGDSELMQVGEGGNEGIEWLLQYAPIYETVEGKKTHSRMLIRAEIPRGSYMKIEMRCDGGSWMDVGRIVGRCAGVVPIRIPVNRCDRFELKLSGRGKFTLQSMLREFHVGSER